MGRRSVGHYRSLLGVVRYFFLVSRADLKETDHEQ
jgi:hypothetical protein